MGSVPNGTFDASLGGMNVNNNYRYDEIGQLIQDEQEEIDTIIWTVSGKVKEVRRPLASSRKNLIFDYSLSRWRATESGMLWDKE